MRALAVLAVVVHHAEFIPYRGGFIGVDLFFVLSGYLITGILLSEATETGEIAVGRFLLNRFLRLMPPLALLIVTVLVVGPYFWPYENFGLVVTIAGLYLSDYMSAFYGELAMLGHTWSLSVEEHFYLIWPLAVLGLSRLTKRGQITALAVAFLVATLWRLANAYHFQDYRMTAYRFDTRVSGLLLGGLLAVSGVALERKAADLIGVASLAGLLILQMVLVEGQPVQSAWMQPIIDIAAAGLVFAALGKGMVSRFLSLRPLAYLGLISYSVYLWHYPISRALMMYTDDWRVMLAGILIPAVLVAALSWHFMEKPLASIRRRFRRPVVSRAI